MEIISSHQLIIFKVCNMYCTNPEDKKDLVQEVILQLWRSFEKYDERFKLSTWIYRITMNVAISNYRKYTTRQKRFQPLDKNLVNIAIEEDRELTEQTQMLWQMIKQLNEFDKALVILYLEEKSYEEIGSILDISKNVVGVRLNRIRQKLKKKIENQ